MTATRSPFDVLGLPTDATPADVRRAYRRLALRHHPDRNPGDPAATEAFLAVQGAYQALDPGDPDAGFDAERVMAQMQHAAEEAERRRSRAPAGGRAWQQVRVALDRPRSAHALAVVRTPRVLGGLAVSAVLAVTVALGLAPFVAVVGHALGGAVGVPVWASVAAGGTLGVLVAGRTIQSAEPPPWAVETHWHGLRDLRWDVLLAWDEIESVRPHEGALDLTLTADAARRLARLVPSEAFVRPDVYRLPLRDASRLLSILEAQRTG